MVSQTINKKQDGTQLFEAMQQTYPDFPEKALASAIKNADITVNGEKANGEDKLKTDDKIDIYLTKDILGLDMTPRIVYQDENLIIVDKPAGLLSFSDNGEPNALDMVIDYMKKQGEYSVKALIIPYLVSSLDKYVSGLLLFAKHEEAYIFLVEAQTQRRITRQYICPVKGKTQESGELMAYHVKEKTAKKARILKKFQKGAKQIVTRYTRISCTDSISLLLVKPVTYCIHQVRAHLAFAGMPVLGDNIYGNKLFNLKNRAANISLWVNKIVFEMGTGHKFEYMNNKAYESDCYDFAKCVYDKGLIEQDNEQYIN